MQDSEDTTRSRTEKKKKITYFLSSCNALILKILEKRIIPAVIPKEPASKPEVVNKNVASVSSVRKQRRSNLKTSTILFDRESIEH